MNTTITKELLSIAGLMALGIVVVLVGGMALAYMNDSAGGNEMLPVHHAISQQVAN